MRAVRDERSPVFQADIYSDRWNIDKPETRKALIEQLVSELCIERFTVFNFAGNREVILEEPVETLLVEVFTKVKAVREGEGTPTS